MKLNLTELRELLDDKSNYSGFTEEVERQLIDIVETILLVAEDQVLRETTGVRNEEIEWKLERLLKEVEI